LLLFTAALAMVLRAIPTSALGAILVYTGYKLVNIDNVRHLARYGKFPVFIYVSTVVGIVATDLLTGVLIGVALSVIKLIYQVSNLNIKVDAKDSQVDIYLKGAATFLSLPKLAATLESLPPGSKVCVHIDDLAYIDHACLDMMSHWKQQHEASGSELEIEWGGLVDRYARLGSKQTEGERQRAATALTPEYVTSTAGQPH
jgi:MFS superfamily sulfate permease-like transporter